MDLKLTLEILKEGLKLWNSKESNKYLNEVIALEKEFYEELGKPDEDRSDLKLDTIMLKLTIISQSFVKFQGKSSLPSV